MIVGGRKARNVFVVNSNESQLMWVSLITAKRDSEFAPGVVNERTGPTMRRPVLILAACGLFCEIIS